MKFLERIRNYLRISKVAPISRRYFVMNAFDGAATILGIVVGACVTEEAERKKKLNSLEKSMLRELENSVVGRASRFALLWTGIVDGVSPAIAAVACLVPFFLSSFGLFPINVAIQVSIGIALSVMFLLGAFLGKVSSRNIFIHGFKMLLVGVILIFIFVMFKLVS